jgi:hypothetical protein
MQEKGLIASDIAFLAAKRTSQVQGLIIMKVFSPANVGMILGMAVGIVGGASERLRNTAFKYVVRYGGKISGQGFKSFTAFKRVMGKAGTGKHWHHIVEQNPTNIVKFGANRIHNTNNIVRVNTSSHIGKNSISAHYSRIMKKSNKTVRQWLSTKSYDFQYKYGLKTLMKYTK